MRAAGRFERSETISWHHRIVGSRLGRDEDFGLRLLPEEKECTDARGLAKVT